MNEPKNRNTANRRDPHRLLMGWYEAERAEDLGAAERALRSVFDLALPLVAPPQGFANRVAGLLAGEFAAVEPSVLENLVSWSRHTAGALSSFLEQALKNRWFRGALVGVLFGSSLFFALFWAGAMAGVGAVSETDPDQVLVASSGIAVFLVEALASLLTIVDVFGAGLSGLSSMVATPKSLGVVSLLTLFSAMALFTLIRATESGSLSGQTPLSRSGARSELS